MVVRYSSASITLSLNWLFQHFVREKPSFFPMIALDENDPNWEMRSDIWSLPVACTVSSFRFLQQNALTWFSHVWIDLRNVHWVWILLRCTMCTRFVRPVEAIGWRSTTSLGFVFGFKWIFERPRSRCAAPHYYLTYLIQTCVVPEISAARARSERMN